ncbi:MULTISPECIES: CGNR zinc finger domain-containing protein [Streptomyces]|uniref:CGNR zinc finger domain-containing protein n=1 Tax=Streptomyces solicathayae TaxID=3081768 RepID=A0ABZ0LX23_9ACTN|nr:CGNR zinc finger domain-containing protein [Streptomyces sp. HUAS YS2]WOX24018.1 CGNR zinc finger domain-containing protein [Streptomyces sp. HUAS YS2]
MNDLALLETLLNTLSIDTGEDRLEAEFGLAGGELEQARELRESLRVACLAHAGHGSHTEVRPLSELLAEAPLVVAVDPATGAASLRPAREGALVARVASAIASTTADGTWPRLKACEAADCHWAYVDRSPGGRRRWCSMSVCGARAKMRTYRTRQG